jgi:hypothetical protein
LSVWKSVTRSVKKENKEIKLETSKYIANYTGNKTPIRGRNNTSNALLLKDSNKREKIQLKIERVKQSLFPPCHQFE